MQSATTNKQNSNDRAFRNFVIFLVLGFALMSFSYAGIGLELTPMQALLASISAIVGFVSCNFAVWKLLSASKKGTD